MHNFIKVLRPHQYLKNTFVLIGPLFAKQWDLVTTYQTAITFISFCAISSSVYILNDITDIESDRRHPTKNSRPIASGSIPIKIAKNLMMALLITAITLSLIVSLWATFFIVLYFSINIAYSYQLKNIVILDIFIISSGFMIRILTGTLGLNIMPSTWLLLCGLMLTLFLGFSKRLAELLMLNEDKDNNSTRRVLADYSQPLLEQFISVTAACTIMAYGLYTVSPITVELHGSANLIYTVPFVAYGIFRYLYLLHHCSKGNDTAEDFFTDRHLISNAIAWTITTLWVLG
ncbi:MAG: decaprenyl-phosphate phosphoribosyltransferase [Gammaproteobacteria bacterium]|nr:decaprenyl-phosphate phosphoribosyltransferase [Gammaproteobacteria bacterium]